MKKHKAALGTPDQIMGAAMCSLAEIAAALQDGYCLAIDKHGAWRLYDLDMSACAVSIPQSDDPEHIKALKTLAACADVFQACVDAVDMEDAGALQ